MLLGFQLKVECRIKISVLLPDLLLRGVSWLPVTNLEQTEKGLLG